MGNSVSKRNVGQGLRDEILWKFEEVWKEREDDEMGEEDLDKGFCFL